MFKNIIIVILVLSNCMFTIFALYQKQLATKENTRAAIKELELVKMEEMVIASKVKLKMARQTADSLRNELAKIQE